MEVRSLTIGAAVRVNPGGNATSSAGQGRPQYIDKVLLSGKGVLHINTYLKLS
jgi:hypothetical protein